MRGAAAAYGVALAAGLALWTAIAMLGHRMEPWDAPLYWQAGYPLAILLSGVFGYVWPERAWRRAAVLMFSQEIVIFARGADFGLLPLGLVLLAVLSLPAIAAAMLAARLAR